MRETSGVGRMEIPNNRTSMKDSELRAFVLQNFYEHRREDLHEPKSEDFSPAIPQSEIYAICDQLEEYGLITWKAAKGGGGITLRGYGKITAVGVDAIETEGGVSPVKLDFAVHNNYTFNSPSNVQVGDHNSQSVVQTFNSIVEKIDSSSATSTEKTEAKSRLKKFLEHPLVATVVGAGMAAALGL